MPGKPNTIFLDVARNRNMPIFVRDGVFGEAEMCLYSKGVHVNGILGESGC